MPCTWAGSCCAMYTMRTGGGHPALTLRAARVLVWLWMVDVVRPLGMRTAPLAAELAMARSEGVALRISSQGGWMGGAWCPSRWWSFAGRRRAYSWERRGTRRDGVPALKGGGLPPAAGDDAERGRRVRLVPGRVDGRGAVLLLVVVVLLAARVGGFTGCDERKASCLGRETGWREATTVYSAYYSPAPFPFFCPLARLRLRLLTLSFLYPSPLSKPGVNYVRGSLNWGPRRSSTRSPIRTAGARSLRWALYAGGDVHGAVRVVLPAYVLLSRRGVVLERGGRRCVSPVFLRALRGHIGSAACACTLLRDGASRASCVADGVPCLSARVGCVRPSSRTGRGAALTAAGRGCRFVGGGRDGVVVAPAIRRLVFFSLLFFLLLFVHLHLCVLVGSSLS
ncbi:hypothetical protein C8J57DRAFT_1563352 [Mycena rebaudengoi]|nr:hypothetical protein C8J57DRAFT_1563352 [Mycena rebaudengoi]